MVASFIGYKEKNVGAIERERGQLEVDMGTITLAPNATVMEAVEIEGERMEMELSLDKRVFNVAQNSTLKGGTALNVLENLPSVEVDVEGNVSLRGSGNVRILIDGRPSGLAGLGSTEALRLLQSDLVERVEVITNPSARYEAEGEAGIINIILRKDKQRGLNGSVDLTAGWNPNFGAAINLNRRGKNVNYFGSYGIRYRNNPGQGYFFQNNLDESGVLESSLERTREQWRGGLNNTVRGGVDIYFNDKNTLTVSGLARIGDDRNEVDLTYEDFDRFGNSFAFTTREEIENETDENYELSASYEKKFNKKGHVWTADARWILSDELEQADQVEQLQGSSGPPTVQRTDNLEKEENFLFQTDYIHPFAEKFQFELGSRITLRMIDNDYMVEQQNEAGVFEVFEGFDDRLRYQEDIYAFYGVLGMKGKPFSWQLGVRAEYTDIAVTSESAQTNIQKDYLNFFPSLSVSYEVAEGNTVQLSYSRRLSRPRFRLLLPFSNFTDARNLYFGNPDLNPEYTDSFEASYLTYWNSGSFLGSVYYRYRTGVIERVITVDENNISRLFPVNLSIQDAYGIEFSFSQDITSWWKMSTNFNFYRAVTTGSFEGINLSNDAWAWTNNLGSKLSIPKLFDMQINYLYRSPRITAQGRRRSISVINIGASKEILKGRGSLTLSVRDLLNSRIRIVELEQENFNRYDEFQWRAGSASLTFNYRLNREEVRQERRRRIKDEQRSGGGDL